MIGRAKLVDLTGLVMSRLHSHVESVGRFNILEPIRRLFVKRSSK